MPHDLFGDVVHATMTIGSRKWYTLPLSIVTHVLVIGSVVVVSLFSLDVLPSVPRYLPPYMAATLKPVDVPQAPESSRVRPAGRDQSAPNPDAAPFEAPDGVQPDSGIVRDPEVANTGAVPGGLPNGIPGGDVNVLPEPPPPPVPASPIRVSGIRIPTRIKNVQPVYPELARQARVSGTVIVEALIGTDGRVTGARVVRSIPLLDQAALVAVSQWLYTPTLLSGVPVSILMTVTVTFRLQ